jgi:3-dehydroquinate synthase
MRLEVRQASRTTAVELGQAQTADGMVLIDSRVAELYPDLARGAIIVPRGERSKSLRQYGRLHAELVAKGANRKSRLIAIGGGVVGDLVGFVAATYMRGIAYESVPTTLLAMVDSSVGGKVAIDLPEGKNLVGSFWPPTRVTIQPQFLNTLPPRQVRNGLAEVLKMGFIRDPFLAEPRPVNAELIFRAIKNKQEVVEADEFETLGIRAILNFGHTIGHAIEAVLGYRGLLHGEAVAVGMAAEAKLGEALGITEPGTAAEVRRVLHEAGLPTSHSLLGNPERLIDRMRSDKKAEGNGLAFSLLNRIGECKLQTGIRESDVVRALRD